MLDGRQAIIKHHILYMQLILLKRSPPCIILSQLDVMEFTLHGHQRMIKYTTQITGHQLYQQLVLLLIIGPGSL